MDETEELKTKLREMTLERNKLHAEYTDMRLHHLEGLLNDHERRMRPLEEAVTKFNFLLFLTLGGGLISAVNLIALLYMIVKDKV